MKPFDRYTIRGVILILLGSAGLVFEVLIKGRNEPFLVIMYTIVNLLGLGLIFFIHEQKP